MMGDKVINKLIRDLYQNTKRSYMEGRPMIDTIDDFKQHFYLQVLEKPEMFNGKTDGDIKRILKGIIWNQLYSKNSTFYYQYRKPKTTECEILEKLTPHSNSFITYPEPDGPNLDDLKELLMMIDLPYLDRQFHILIFWMRYEEEMKTKEIAKIVGVEVKYIQRSLRQTRNYLKNNIENKWTRFKS